MAVTPVCNAAMLQQQLPVHEIQDKKNQRQHN
uniref:Uncharacterized protein n=1 Tax=Arundo donax TaxID=35708 RepID=A0A0A9BRC7_ARUDO